MDPPQAGLVAFNVMFVLLSLCPYLITTDFLQQIILRAAHLCNVVALQFMTVLFFDINLLALLQRVRVYDILTRLLKHPAFFPPYLRLQGVRLRRHFTVSCDITFPLPCFVGATSPPESMPGAGSQPPPCSWKSARVRISGAIPRRPPYGRRPSPDSSGSVA